MNRYYNTLICCLLIFISCSKKREKAIKKAEMCLEKRYYQLAISELKPYEGDKDPKIQYLLGNALLGDDRLEQASYRYEMAVKLNPSYKESVAISYAKRGSELYKVGSHTEAITLYRKALYYTPDNPKYLIRLGDLYLKTQRFDLASFNYSSIITITKDSLLLQKAYESLIKSYTGMDDLAKASEVSLQALDKGIHTLSYLAGEVFYKYGLFLFKRGELDSAFTILQRVIDLNVPVSLIDDAEYTKGEIWFSRGNYNKAKESYSTVLRINPFFKDTTRMKAEEKLSLIKKLK